LPAGGQEYLIRDTVAALERKLDPDQFVRVHRSTIVNLDRVQELSPWTGASSFVEVAAFNSEPNADRCFEKRLGRER
jgi:two-component system LytT family response regulator